MSDDLELPESPESGHGLLGLSEVEPSPIENTPYEQSKDSYFPSSSTSPSPPPTRTSTFGLGSHKPIYYLLRVQKYSSYTFTVFAFAHLANTSLLPLVTRSLPASDKLLLLIRPYYQSFPLEALLVALPLAVHVTSGITLRLYRRSQALARYGAESRIDRRTIRWPEVSWISATGFALTPIALSHVFVTRVLPMYAHGDNSMINLSYVAHGFAAFPASSFVGYVALIGVASAHFVWGWAKWMGWTPKPGQAKGLPERKRRVWGINGAVGILAGLWYAGGLGIVGRGGRMGGWVGKEFDELYSYLPRIMRFS